MLFKPRPAYRFRSQQGIASAPNSAVRVDSVPEGADLTYYLPAALADTAAVPDSARQRRPAKLVILGASGDTVRVLEGERKPGLNRLWWDLRYTRPTVPKLRTPPPGKPSVRPGPDAPRPLVPWALDLSLGGPLVPRGSSRGRLRVGDSAATAATLTQSLTVLKDPNTAASDADVAAQTRLSLAIRGAQDSVARMINRLEWVRKQLADLSGQLRGDTALPGDSSPERPPQPRAP